MAKAQQNQEEKVDYSLPPPFFVFPLSPSPNKKQKREEEKHKKNFHFHPSIHP